MTMSTCLVGRYLPPAPRPARDLPALSAGAAYTRALAVIGVLQGPHVAGNVMAGLHVRAPWWTSGWGSFGPSLIMAAVWVAVIEWRRRGRLGRWHGVAAGLVGYAAAVPALAGGAADLAGLNDAAEPLGVVGMLAAALVLIPAVCSSVGINSRNQLAVAPLWAARRAGWWQAVAVYLVAVAGFATAYVLLIKLASIDWLPQMSGSQTETLGITSQLSLWVTGTVSGPAEELILLAAPLVLLSAARRPTWEICLLAVAARVVGYLYLQTAAASVVVFVLLNAALWLRCRRLVPLAAAHTTLNTVVWLGPDGPDAIYTLGTLLWPALVIAVPCWLTARPDTTVPPTGVRRQTTHNIARSAQTPTEPINDETTGTSDK